MDASEIAVTAAWLLAGTHSLYQYALRCAPAVMIPQLSGALDLIVLGVSSLVRLFYCVYPLLCIVSGAALDHLGPRTAIPLGVVAGVGALLFGSGDVGAALIGRFVQGAGGVFAQDAHGSIYGSAVARSATVPLGLAIRCAVVGMISDRIVRRKPVTTGTFRNVS